MRGSFRVVAFTAVAIGSSCGLPPEGEAIDDGAQATSARELERVVVVDAYYSVWLEGLKRPADASSFEVEIDRSVTLNPTDVITKRLIFRGSTASGVVFDCNGATISAAAGTYNHGSGDIIEVRSAVSVDRATNVATWTRPVGVTIKNCNVIGAMRIWGMDKNGQGYQSEGYENSLKKSSYQAGHTVRVRNAAPTRTVLDNLTVTALPYRIPLYLSPGVTETQLINSTFLGEVDGVSIYLDAESGSNLIRNNKFHTATSKQQIAVDGSSNNRIIDNYFSALSNGGIFLYRNCGEGGVSRHNTPSSNQIINNVFFYRDYYIGPTAGLPSIHIGSRNGNPPGFEIGGWGSYCDEDDEFSSYGSGESDLDYAQNNIVMQNQIYKNAVSYAIRLTNATVNSANQIRYNTNVYGTTPTAHVVRLAGCYVGTAPYKDFIEHGTFIDVNRDARGLPVCSYYQSACSDSFITLSRSSCSLVTEPIDCQVTNNNNGCSRNASCPAGRRIVGVRAACNLEYGAVTDTDVAGVFGGRLKVVRASDTPDDGRCWVHGTSIRTGEATIANVLDRVSVTTGCDEYDSNGGDCHIKGTLFCR